MVGPVRPISCWWGALLFQFPDKTKVSDDTVQQIVELIRTGDYSPGDRLPSERKLANELGVSRTSVREALRKLETVGLLDTRQGRGTFVKDPSREVIQSAFVPYLVTDEGKLWKLFELREIIEVEAAARAAANATELQIEDIRRWSETMATSFARDDMEATVLADVEFHRQIIIATGNEILVDLMDSLVDLLRDMRRASPNFPDLLPQSLVDHKQILAALEAGDAAGSRAAMQAHLDHVREASKSLWKTAKTDVVDK